MMCGGHSQPKEMDEESKNILQGLKELAETHSKQKYDKFEGVSYTTQVVAGTNFVFTVDIGDNKHILVKAFRPLPHTKEPIEVTDVQPK